jgi:hypothetical protein
LIRNDEVVCKEAKEVNSLFHFESIHFHIHAILFSFLIGVDMWATLHAQLLALILSFSKIAITCKKKFNTLLKQYKKDKMASEVSRNDCHECKFYDSMDPWWNQIGVVFKHVLVSTNDMDLQHEIVEQVENGYLIEREIEAIIP